MIKLNMITHRSHCAQICTGFELLFKNRGFKQVVFEDHSCDSNYPFHTFPIVEVEYNGKTLMYDTEDGYKLEWMNYYLSKCDFYFKRSYSEDKNRELFSEEERRKIYPLGFGYEVFSKNNPYRRFEINNTTLLKYILGKKPAGYFTFDKFEGSVSYKSDNMKIIFFTRLWERSDSLTKEFNDERDYINEIRVEIIRQLRKQYGRAFIGGLYSNSVSEKMAPELILNRFVTEKAKYLKVLRESDIAIGTMGLHESTGWKTAEYIAAGKAIVSESLHYEVPGDFAPGKNYLGFSNVEECLEAVDFLYSHPMTVYEMKCRNIEYYLMYLKPEIMIRRTLDIVDAAL